MTKSRILLVEDDHNIRKGLLDVFVFNGYEAEGAEEGCEGCQRALAGRYDLIMLDVMLPGMDGFSICQRVRSAKPEQAIMMLTARGSEDDIVRGFQAGADDYVSKPFSLKELMVRVEALLRRSGRQSVRDRFSAGSINFDPVRLVAEKGGKEIELSRRELDIVAYLLRGQSGIVSKQELLREVWNYSAPEIETRTVDITVARLRKKLETLTAGKPIIVTVRGEGYRLDRNACSG